MYGHVGKQSERKIFVMLLQLSLCVVIVIQMTSSQSTYDIVREDNDVSSCGRTEQVFSQLMTAVQQLRRDLDELKAASQHKDVKGTLEICTCDLISKNSYHATHASLFAAVKDRKLEANTLISLPCTAFLLQPW